MQESRISRLEWELMIDHTFEGLGFIELHDHKGKELLPSGWELDDGDRLIIFRKKASKERKQQ